MQLKDLQNKIIHFNLNLDYPIDDIPIDIQTNALINRVLNNFYNIYKDNIQQYSVVYEYRDDCISLVGLRLIQILAEQMNFNFEIFGKVKKFKKKVGKTRRTNEKEINKKDNVLLISNFNPIYKVNLEEDLSKKINYKQRYNIVEQFTPDEFTIAFHFYGGNIDELDKNDVLMTLDTLRFNKWIKNLQGAAIPQFLMTELMPSNPVKVNIITLSNIISEDEKLLQEVEQSDNINLYYTQAIKHNILTDKTFAAYVKNKSNVPNDNYLNINVNLGEIMEYISPTYYGERQGGEPNLKEEIK